MKSKIFSYQVEGIVLGPVNEMLKTSAEFDRKAVIEKITALFKDENYKVDERTLRFKIKDEQLFIEGMVMENEEPKTIGFLSGKVNG